MPDQIKSCGINPSLVEYYEITRHAKASPQLVEAMRYVDSGNEALDLGCGAGRDTRYLLGLDFNVTAVDAETLAGNQLPHSPKLQFVNSTFDQFRFGLNRYDLINAHFSLPYNSPNTFDTMFGKLKASLKFGGVFVGQLFGNHDEWALRGRHMTFHTREQAEAALHGLKIIEFEEIDQDGTLANGTPKHWHRFDIIAKQLNQDVVSKPRF